MDPITVSVVSALAAGAAAVGKEFATSAIQDAYSALKTYIVDKFSDSAPFLKSLEKNPESPAQQEVLAANLPEMSASAEARKLAEALLEALQDIKDEPGARALFDFDTLRALKKFELDDIHLSGPLLRARQATFEEDFKATRIRQTSPAEGDAKKK